MNDIYLNILLEKLYNGIELEERAEKVRYRSWNMTDAEMTYLLQRINPERFELQKELLNAKQKCFHIVEEEAKADE